MQDKLPFCEYRINQKMEQICIFVYLYVIEHQMCLHSFIISIFIYSFYIYVYVLFMNLALAVRKSLWFYVIFIYSFTSQIQD